MHPEMHGKEQRGGGDKERRESEVVLKIGGKKKERCGMRNATRNTNIAKFNRGVRGDKGRGGQMGEEQGGNVKEWGEKRERVITRSKGCKHGKRSWRKKEAIEHLTYWGQ